MVTTASLPCTKARDTVLDRFTTTDHIFDLRIRTAVPLRDLVRSQG